MLLCLDHSFSLLSFLKFFFSLSVGLFFVVLVVVVCCQPVVWLSLPVAFGIAAETQFTGWCLLLAFTTVGS